MRVSYAYRMLIYTRAVRYLEKEQPNMGVNFQVNTMHPLDTLFRACGVSLSLQYSIG
jgi:hypothetical protein